MFSLADTCGTHVSFDAGLSRIIREAIEETRAKRGVNSVLVSGRSLSELGVESLPKSASPLGGLLVVLWILALLQ